MIPCGGRRRQGRAAAKIGQDPPARRQPSGKLAVRLFFAFILAGLFLVAPAAAEDLKLEGAFQQGGLIFGKTQPGSLQWSSTGSRSG